MKMTFTARTGRDATPPRPFCHSIAPPRTCLIRINRFKSHQSPVILRERLRDMKRLLALIARLIGLLLLLTAFAVLGHDLLAWREKGAFAPGRGSPVMVTGLKSWVVPVLAVPGLVLAWAFRKRRG